MLGRLLAVGALIATSPSCSFATGDDVGGSAAAIVTPTRTIRVQLATNNDTYVVRTLAPMLALRAWRSSRTSTGNRCDTRARRASMSAPDPLVARVIGHWRELRVGRPGASRASIQAVEARLGSALPTSLVTLLGETDGMNDGETDHLTIRFWPVAELTWARDELEDAAGDSSAGFVVFADYSIWAHAYAVKVTPGADHDSVAILGGDRPIVLAPSFSRFLVSYLDTPSLFFRPPDGSRWH
jgi:hypothetical protein